MPLHGVGGLERSVHDLVRHLAARDVEVTLIAPPAAPHRRSASDPFASPRITVRSVPYVTFPFANRRGTTVLDRSTAYPVFGVTGGPAGPHPRARGPRRSRAWIRRQRPGLRTGETPRAGAARVQSPRAGRVRRDGGEPARPEAARLLAATAGRACVQPRGRLCHRDRRVAAAHGGPAPRRPGRTTAHDSQRDRPDRGERTGRRGRRPADSRAIRHRRGHARDPERRTTRAQQGIRRPRGRARARDAQRKPPGAIGRGAGSSWEPARSRAIWSAPSRTTALADHTLFAGKASDADLHAWYEAANVFVHPTRYEGSSIVTLEAMAHRQPVVASRAGGLPDKVRPGLNGWLVPPDDAGALSAALEDALSDPARLQAMGQHEPGDRRAGVRVECAGCPVPRTVPGTSAAVIAGAGVACQPSLVPGRFSATSKT